MASLIVQLHELTNKYIKHAKNKDITGKICSEILLRSREVAKTYLWDGENACMFYVLRFIQFYRGNYCSGTTSSREG
jgi:hypothetical protein